MAKWDDLLDLLTVEELKMIHPDAPPEEGVTATTAGIFARIMTEAAGDTRFTDMIFRFTDAIGAAPADSHEPMMAEAIDRRLKALE